MGRVCVGVPGGLGEEHSGLLMSSGSLHIPLLIMLELCKGICLTKGIFPFSFTVGLFKMRIILSSAFFCLRWG